MEEQKQNEAARELSAPAPKPKAVQPVRAMNEDDDGYDPYTDYHDQGPKSPLFEPDPWR